MSLRNKNGLAVLLRAFLLFFSFFTVERIFSDPYWGSYFGNFLYYPNLSKLCMIAVTLAYLGFGFRTRMTGGTRIPRAVQLIRYAVVVAVTFSLLYDCCSFFLTLSSQLRPLWFNFLTRAIVPALFITDFLAFDRGEPMERADIVVSVALPALFLAYTFIYVMADSPFYLNGHPYYYFFTDLNAGGMAPEADIGVVWSGLILFGSSLAIGALYRLIQLKTIRPAAAPEGSEEP